MTAQRAERIRWADPRLGSVAALVSFSMMACVPQVPPDGTGSGDGVEPGVDILVPNEGADHVPTTHQVTYQSNPPASGAHWSAAGIAPVAPGYYEGPVEEEQWVHNLEHGYIVLLYDCRGACDSDLLNDLRNFFDTVPLSPLFGETRLVIAPYDGLPFRLTAVAWDHQLHLEAFDEATLTGFYNQYVEQGPELVP